MIKLWRIGKSVIGMTGRLSLAGFCGVFAVISFVGLVAMKEGLRTNLEHDHTRAKFAAEMVVATHALERSVISYVSGLSGGQDARAVIAEKATAVEQLTWNWPDPVVSDRWHRTSGKLQGALNAYDAGKLETVQLQNLTKELESYREFANAVRVAADWANKNVSERMVATGNLALACLSALTMYFGSVLIVRSIRSRPAHLRRGMGVFASVSDETAGDAIALAQSTPPFSSTIPTGTGEFERLSGLSQKLVAATRRLNRQAEKLLGEEAPIDRASSARVKTYLALSSACATGAAALNHRIELLRNKEEHTPRPTRMDTAA